MPITLADLTSLLLQANLSIPYPANWQVGKGKFSLCKENHEDSLFFCNCICNMPSHPSFTFGGLENFRWIRSPAKQARQARAARAKAETTMVVD